MAANVPAKTNGNGGHVATRDNDPPTLRQLLASDVIRNQIARAVPKHCNPDRMLRIATTAISRTPKLAQCDQASFMQALMDLSQWGLEPDGRHAHLLPFENRKKGIVECQLIIDYKGLVQLLYRAGQVRTVHADIVYEGDDFVYDLGEVTKHTPWDFRLKFERPEEKGAMVAAYCRVVLKGGAVKCEVMTKADIDAIRARSRAKDSGPWVTDYFEMARKTVFRRCSKWLPLSAEIIEAFDRDFDAPGFNAAPMNVGRATPSTLNAQIGRAPEPVEDQPAEPSEPKANPLACPECSAPMSGSDPEAQPASYACGSQMFHGEIAKRCGKGGDGKLFDGGEQYE